jgi:hypothetical protein
MKRIDADRARRLAWLALGIYAAVMTVAAVLRVQGDFNVYYRAGTRVLDGVAIYRLDESSHFLYAPVFALMFAPLAALPLKAAQFAWCLVSMAGLFAMIAGTNRMLFGRERKISVALVIVPLILAERFVGNDVEHGQINLPTLALIIWSIVFAEEGRDGWAGLALATALLIKPYAALGALFLACERRWKALGWALAAALGLLAVPALFLGPRGALEQTAAYVRVVLSMTGRYRLMLTNQSASSAFARILTLGAAPGAGTASASLYAGMAVELALVLAVAIWCMMSSAERRGAMLPRRFPLAALFCLMPSFAPVSWKSYYSALLVPYALLLAALWAEREGTDNQKAPRLAWAMLILSVVINWLPGKMVNRIALFYSVHFVASLLVLGSVVVTARWARGRAAAQRIGPRCAANG